MKIFNRKTLFTSCALVALLNTAAPINAENQHLGKDVASTEEIIDLLMPSGSNVKVRGLRLKNETATAPGAPAVAEASEPKSISLEIYFDFDSAALSAEAMAQLAPVGEALASMELESLEFALEGYTDASGDESYNQKLSERRAQAVSQYFVDQYGVSRERLAAVGRGEADLLDPENPTSEKNRRVKIIAR